MSKSNTMIYAVLAFIIVEALCFIIASFIGGGVQAQNVEWNSQLVNYPVGTIVKSKEITVCNNGVFTKKIIYDTIANAIADVDIVRLDSLSNKVKLKPTVSKEIKDTTWKAYEPPPALWNKCSEQQKREWCHRAALAILEGNDLPQTVYQYLLKYSEYAIYEYNATGILASGTLAQALVESTSKKGVAGGSTLCSTHNNHFGIKCHEWRKKKVWFPDDCKGKPCCFRAYATDAESYADHSKLLLEMPRYKRLIKTKTLEDYCREIGRSGYATSLSYRAHLNQIGIKYKLSKFDVSFNTSYWKYNSDKPSNPISSW